MVLAALHYRVAPLKCKNRVFSYLVALNIPRNQNYRNSMALKELAWTVTHTHVATH